MINLATWAWTVFLTTYGERSLVCGPQVTSTTGQANDEAAPGSILVSPIQ